MRIPIIHAERHDPHAALDQPPGEQEVAILAVRRQPIALARPLVGLVPIEGVGQFAGGDHFDGPLIERVHRLHRVAGVQFAANAIQLAEQPQSVVQSV